MQSNVDQLIEVMAGDLIAGTREKPTVAINAEFYMVLLALLLHYHTGETMRDLIEDAK